MTVMSLRPDVLWKLVSFKAKEQNLLTIHSILQASDTVLNWKVGILSGGGSGNTVTGQGREAEDELHQGMPG